MDECLKKIIIRICQSGLENRTGIGQVRATKLMYLIEWEYYAWIGERLTNLDWQFYHYGPWSGQLSKILQDEFKARYEGERESGGFRQVYWEAPEFTKVDTHLSNVGLEGIVQRVLSTFGGMKTEDIVRYAYCNTEPMQHAQRGKPLDFSCSRRPISPFCAAKSLKKNIREELRQKFQAATKAASKAEADVEGDMPSELAFELSKTDILKEWDILAGPIRISEEGKRALGNEL